MASNRNNEKKKPFFYNADGVRQVTGRSSYETCE